jgi:hypothetical protein
MAGLLTTPLKWLVNMIGHFMIIELNNAKVFKHFGSCPERGRLMKGFTTIKKTAGMRAQVLAIVTPAGQMVGTRKVPNPCDLRGEFINYEWRPNPIEVWPVLALKNAGGSRWEVQVKPEYLTVALQWLRDHCLYDTYKPPVKKRRKRGFKKPKF